MQKYKVQGEVRPGDRNVIFNVETLDKIARCGQRTGGQRTEPWGVPGFQVQEMEEGRKKGRREGRKEGGEGGERRGGMQAARRASILEAS